MVDNFIMVDSKKYMWDGQTYEGKAQAEEAKSKYETAKFETEMVEEEGKFYVYSRRVVTEIVLEGAPPV